MKFRNLRQFLILPAALSLLLSTPLAVAADAAGQYQAWRQAVEALTASGFTAIEEIESKLFGRLEVEALHDDGNEYQLTMNSAAKLSNKQLRGPQHASADRLDLQTVSRVLNWLEEHRYSDLDQIAGDDGLIEVEAIGPDGKRQEIKLNPTTLQIVARDHD